MVQHRPALYLTISMLLCVFSAHGFYTSDFYRAAQFPGEPRFERDRLTSFSLDLYTDTTRESFLCNSKEQPLLDLYGTQNLHYAGLDIPEQQQQQPYQDLLNQLARETGSPCFANLSFSGQYRFFEANISAYQNFRHGVFVGFDLPVRILKLCNIQYKDCTPQNEKTATWLEVFNNFPSILHAYDRAIYHYKKKDTGDLRMYLGWTKNYEDTIHLDYVDVTFKTGAVCPTSKATDFRNIFSIPAGYNKHWGIPFELDVALGAYDWMTLGGYVHGLLLRPKTKTVSIKTNEKQNSLLHLATGTASVHLGSRYDLGLYAKADHIFWGLSFLLGYTYNGQGDTTLFVKDSQVFDPHIANTDQALNGWHMHTLHFEISYDFATHTTPSAPFLALSVDHTLAGEHIFKTTLAGVHTGFNITWRY